MGTENESQIKNAGLCLAVIATQELPQDRWPEFLPRIVQNAQNENYFHRLASIQTVNQLAELIEEDSLSEEQICSILHCSVNNIQKQHLKICKLAMEALTKIIPNTAKNFQNDLQRNSIMNSISLGIETNDEDIV